MTRSIIAVAVVLAAQSLSSQDLAVTTIVDDEEAKQFVITIGPIDLPSTGDHHGGHNGIFPPLAEVEIPRHAYLWGFEWDIVDGDGTPMPREVLHHLNIIDPVRRELFLPISQRMAAVGGETLNYDLPWLLFGYPVRAGQSMVVVAMMHNPTGRDLSDVHVKFYFKYLEVGRPWPLFDVYPFQLDVAFPAGDKSFTLPPGRSSFSYEATPALEGRMLGIGAHLHEYAENITFEDVTTGEQIWEGLPILGEDGELHGVTVGRLYRTGGARLFTDHVYRVTVRYDNPTGDSIPEGGMGVVAGIFSPGGGYAWPTVDRADTLYALDRAHYMREVRGTLDVIRSLVSGSGPPRVEDEHAEHEHAEHTH